jgi:hypothetical protein
MSVTLGGELTDGIALSSTQTISRSIIATPEINPSQIRNLRVRHDVCTPLEIDGNFVFILAENTRFNF